MKRFTGFFTFGAVLGLVFANLNWDYPQVNEAHASERAVCGVILPTDGGPGTTARPQWGRDERDGGFACPWVRGAVVGIQCGNDVYYDPCKTDTANTTGELCGAARGTADQFDTKVDFTTYKDPYKIELRSNEQEIQVLAATTGTTGDAGSCIFFTTLKKNGGL